MSARKDTVRAIVAIGGLFLLSRALVLLVARIAVETMGAPPELASVDVAALLCRWDCGWYLNIVYSGYSTVSDANAIGATTYAFFPVFPMLVRALSTTFDVAPQSTAIVVSNLAFFGALIYIYQYARLVGSSDRAALLAVALICFLPQGIVFSAVYTESLFLFLLAAAFYHFRRGHYLVAGLAAAVMSATRANGVLFLVFAVACLAREFGWRAFLAPWRNPERYLPIVLAPFGLFLFWAWCFTQTGDAFAQMSSVGHGWGWRSGFFLENLSDHLSGPTDARFWVIASLIAFSLSLLLLRYGFFAEFAFCAAMFLLLWSGRVPNSLLRYVLVLFPIWMALARALEPRPWATALTLAAFSLVNGMLTVAWALGRLISI